MFEQAIEGAGEPTALSAENAPVDGAAAMADSHIDEIVGDSASDTMDESVEKAPEAPESIGG